MKIVSVQDISCYGQCSLTVALPILSSRGIETAILPSAVLSTHTSGFKNFTVHDLTEEMGRIIAHWKDEKIKYDAVYTGYIGDARQFDYVLDMKKNLLNEKGLLFVDPAMADHGKMYYGLGQDIINGMRKICAEADYILPNITEACFLTDTPYQEEQDDKFISTLLDRCLALGCKNVILTGVKRGNFIGSVCYDGENRTEVLNELQEVSYHGTGDIYSSVIIADIMNGKNMKETLSDANEFVIKSIKKTKDDPSHWYGVKFEEVLHEGE